LATNTSVLALGLVLLTAPVLASDSKTPAAETTVSSSNLLSRESAREATEAAVSDAVNAVIAANRLDLDIRLIGRASVIVAADK
jgi:hypothetical protein